LPKWGPWHPKKEALRHEASTDEGRGLPADIGLEMLDDVLLFFDDMPDDVSNGNHSTRLPQSTTGRWRKCLSTIICMHSSILVSGETVNGFTVIVP